MRPRLRAIFAAAMPLRVLRVLGYRLLLGYRMPFGTRIGFLALVDAKSVRIGRGVSIARGVRLTRIATLDIGDEVRIGVKARISAVKSASIGARTTIGGRTVFQAPSWVDRPGSLDLAERVVVTGQHFFDLTRDIEVGRHTTVGGIRSSFWTHGAGSQGGRAPIRIGSRCYLASDVKVGAGVVLPDRTLVGLGSVVVKGPEVEGAMIAGVPARVVRDSWKIDEPVD